MARADLMLMTSDSEGQSIAVLEALAAGTPVVTTPVAGMRDLDGVAVADFTAEGLAAAVRGLCATRSGAPRSAPRARDSCTSAFPPM